MHRIRPSKSNHVRLISSHHMHLGVARETWATLFESQGMKNPEPRIRMLDGFNQGWIDFEDSPETIRKNAIPLKTVLQSLLERAPA